METSSENLRKLATEIREYAEKIKEAKTIKCAKYVVGMTALIQLKNKINNFKK